MKIEDPFHAGEIEAQHLAGEAAIAEGNSAVIADSIIAGALPFLKQQKMVVIGTKAEDGSLWASPLLGLPGFVSPADDRTVHFHRAQIRMSNADIFWRNLYSGARAGMLAIELSTRRRLRVNGTLDSVSDDGFILTVQEAYPNCPKYIQRRTLTWSEDAVAETGAVPQEGSLLSFDATKVIEATDTLFIASAHAERGLDMSHRGGNPGFIERLSENRLRVPDYGGNSLFNTFGNLLVDPRAGVTMMDFAGGRILQMTGDVAIEWNQSDQNGVTGGTGRFWTFTVQRWRIVPLPGAARWEFLDASPFNPKAK